MQSLGKGTSTIERLFPVGSVRRLYNATLLIGGFDVKYLGVIFDKKVTWRLHIEMIEAKAFRIFIRIYSLFKSGGGQAYDRSSD
jgi:DUF2075 family protein